MQTSFEGKSASALSLTRQQIVHAWCSSDLLRKSFLGSSQAGQRLSVEQVRGIIGKSASPSMLCLLNKHESFIGERDFLIRDFTFNTFDNLKRKDWSQQHSGTVVDFNLFKAAQSNLTFGNYGGYILTNFGAKLLRERFGKQLGSDQLQDTHHNLAKLISSPELLKKIDCLLLIWNGFRCGEFFEVTPYRSEVGDAAAAIVAISETLYSIAEEAEILLPELLRVRPSGEEFSQLLIFQKILQEVAQGQEGIRSQFGGKIPATSFEDLALTQGRFDAERLRCIMEGDSYSHDLDALVNSMKLTAVLSGGNRYEVQVPVNNQQLLHCLQTLCDKDLAVELAHGSESLKILRQLFKSLQANSTALLLAIVKANFTPCLQTPEVQCFYEHVKGLVGYFDFIGALATKAVDAARERQVEFCFPTTFETINRVGGPAGILSKRLVRPFKPKHVDKEQPNDTDLGGKVKIIAGPGSSGKTYFFVITNVEARIAAGMGDVVYANSYAFDPEGRMFMPFTLEELDEARRCPSSTGGGDFGLTLKVLRTNLHSIDLGAKDTIILDQPGGGVVGEGGEEALILDLFRGVSEEKGASVVCITHCKDLINGPLIRPGIPELSVLNAPMIRGPDGSLKHTFEFVVGRPNWTDYDQNVMQLIYNTKGPSWFAGVTLPKA